MTTAVAVDVAGGPAGGAARFRDEFYSYIYRNQRSDIAVVGAGRRLTAYWLARRELSHQRPARRVALNNVGFMTPGGERWTLLGNAIHFLTESELDHIPRSLRPATRQAPIVRYAARRSDVLIAPCSAMAERVVTLLPETRHRVVVRMHPVTAHPADRKSSEQVILCPVVFSPYKSMPTRIEEWLTASQHNIDPSVQLHVTATHAELPSEIAENPRIKILGRLSNSQLRTLWATCRAIYFPPGLESFGFPLAEARAAGIPVIARNTTQNQEIAGKALCGFKVGDMESLEAATKTALSMSVAPDPRPFNPQAYFDWLLGTDA